MIDLFTLHIVHKLVLEKKDDKDYKGICMMKFSVKMLKYIDVKIVG